MQQETVGHTCFRYKELTWHPVGDASITPLKAQILVACRYNRISSSSLGALASGLSVSHSSLLIAMAELNSQRLLFTHGNSDTINLLTDAGLEMLSILQIRNPKFILATQIHLTENGLGESTEGVAHV